MKNLKSQSAFSLVELLIGMTISVIALTVMVNSVVITDKQKKLTTSTSDLQASGQISSYYLNKDLRMAGYGLTREVFSNCTVNGYDTSRAAGLSFAMVPTLITPGSGLGADTLQIVYGSADVTTTTAKTLSALTGANNNITVDNRFGFRPGDLSVLFLSSVDANADGVPDCVLSEVTSIPSSSGQTNDLVRTTGSYTNGYTGKSTPTKYNKSGGMGIAYAAGSQVFNLGGTPGIYRYSVETGNIFRRTNLLTGETQDIGDNVVGFKAYYIKDTNLDGVADTLDQTSPTSVDGWKQVLAIRYALITRTNILEEDPITSLTVVPAMTLPSGTTTAPVTIALSGNDSLYRYRVYGSTVALRNIVWRDS